MKTVEELIAQNEELKKMLDSRREQRFINVYPDAELPKRILESYLEDIQTVSEPPRLSELMNKWQAERNKIILEAIKKL